MDATTPEPGGNDPTTGFGCDIGAVGSRATDSPGKGELVATTGVPTG
jgi:hypothetical protein